MSIIYLLREGAPACVFNAIFISLVLIISLLILAGGIRKTGKTFEEILFFKMEAIFKVFLNPILTLGIIIIIIFTPFSALFFTMGGGEFEQITYVHLYLIFILLLGLGFLIIGLFRRALLRKKLWKTCCEVIPNLRMNPEPLNQDLIFTFMNRLKMIVGWISIIALLLALWGFVDFFILFLTDAMYDLNEAILVMIPFLKLSIAVILFIGTYFLMVRPINKVKFWQNVMSG